MLRSKPQVIFRNAGAPGSSFIGSSGHCGSGHSLAILSVGLGAVAFIHQGVATTRHSTKPGSHPIAAALLGPWMVTLLWPTGIEWASGLVNTHYWCTHGLIRGEFKLSHVLGPSVIANQWIWSSRSSHNRYSAHLSPMLFDEGGQVRGVPLHFPMQDITFRRTTDPHILPWGSLYGHPCWLPASPDTSDDFWRDSTIPAQRSRVQLLSVAGLVAWPSEHGETDAHRGIPSLRFSRTPLPPTSHIALANTARDGDVIDNPGCIDLIAGWERTRGKSAIALSDRWLWIALIV